jgi:hypothetical protein
MENLLYLKVAQAGEAIQRRQHTHERKLLEHLEDFLRSLEKDDLDLQITCESDESQSLRDIARRLREQSVHVVQTESDQQRPHVSMALQLPGNTTLSESDAESIRELAGRIEPILKAEALRVLVYVVDTAERKDVDLLLNRAEEFFAPKVFEFLPLIAQFDFEEASKALAFKLPMGAATLSFRACEAVFRGYYLLLRGESPKERTSFKPLQQALVKWDTNRQYTQTLGFLDTVIAFRNRTIHPEGHYDTREAASLFRICVDACSQMIRDIEPNPNKREGNNQLKKLLSAETQHLLFKWIQSVDSPSRQEDSDSIAE